jgi:hypothetical protein
VPAIVVRAAHYRLTDRDLDELAALRRALDDISAPSWWAAEAG